MREKKIKVDYIANWRKHDDGVITPVKSYRYFTSNHVKRYYNTLHLLAGVNGCARNVIEYFCERMDNNNMIASNYSMRSQFILDIKKWTDNKLEYTDGSVKKAIHTLVSKGLLLKTKKRGTLQVNPEYYFKDTEENRARNIRMILNFDPEELEFGNNKKSN